MKLTTPESIQENEKEFIDTINAELDWDAIEQLLLDKYGLNLQDEVDYQNGDLVVHGDQIAYKFDFEIKVPLSVIFNRQGECIELSTSRGDEDVEDTVPELEPDSQDQLPVDAVPKRPGELASDISEITGMISEINQGDES